MNSSRQALKSGVWYTLSNFLVKSIGFITTPIFTRLLTKEDFGLYNNYLSWLAIITIIVTFNLDSTLISARYDFENKFDEYILSILTLSSISTVFWIVIVYIFPSFFIELLGMSTTYINAMFLYLFFIPAITLFQTRERYFFEYKKTVATSVFLSISTAIISVVLVINLNNKFFGRVIGSIVPTIVLGIIFYIYFIRKGKKVRVQYWKYALPICLPFIPHLLSLNVLNSMDRVMITKWCGAEDNALYSLAYTCGSMVTLLMTSMNSAFAPWIGEKLNSKDYKQIKQFSKIYISSFSLLAIGIMTVAPEVLWILGGNNYIEAKYVMTPIAMGCVCQFLYTMFVNIEQFKKKTVGMAVASVVAALVNYILNCVFIPRYGYVAAAYTTLVGYLCLLIIHMFLVYKLKLDKVYDYKMITITVILIFIITMGMSILYSYTIIRYAIFGVYLIFLIMITLKHKDKILSVIKRR